MTKDLYIYLLLLFFITLGVLIFGIGSITKKIFSGYKNIINIFESSLNRRSINNFVNYWLLQKRVIRTNRGIIHMFIYIGIIILFIGTVIRAFDYYFYEGLISGNIYIIFKLVMNFGGLFVLFGILTLIIIRLIYHPKELSYNKADWLFLFGLLYMVLTGFILSGIVSILKDRPIWVDPIGNLFGFIVYTIFKDISVIENFYRILWLSHLILAQFLIMLIPWTKIGHWFYSIFNIILARRMISSPRPITNVLQIVEKGENIGVLKMSDFSWKQRLDFMACTFCGRCETKCPAFASGKPLSPANLVQTLRDALIKDKKEEIVPYLIRPDVIWSCTTCGACVFECPVLIHQVETIIDLRRGLISKNENAPDQALLTLNNVMRSGNPFGLSYYDRDEWLENVIKNYNVEFAEEGKEYEYIYWIGCVMNFDSVQRQNAEALLKILSKCKLKVAILKEEICCGEPIRKIGDEFTFYNHAEQVAKKLEKYRFKYLLTSCPHCYTTFKNDFASYGYNIKVIHYVQLISELLNNGKIKINKKIEQSVTYHDPCNLARWNNIYEEPRKIIQQTVNDFKEMKRTKTNTFCCGAGGGQLFYQINIGERVSKIRTKEAAETGSKILVVSCPFCFSMLKGDAEEYGLEIKDLAKLVSELIEEEKK